jgi:uncharacterized protein
VYAALFKIHTLHEKLVEALAGKNMGMTRDALIAATGVNSGGGLSSVLEELISYGFVKQIFPIKKGKENALFRLVDEFTLFYYKFLHNTKNKTSSWQQISSSAAYLSWSGYAFEGICLRHIQEIKHALA